MYVLMGKTFNADNHTLYNWVVGASEDPKTLVNRKIEIEKLLHKFNCFYTTTGPFIEKRNLMYNECLQIKTILNESKLDLGCNYVNSAGIQYFIIETVKL